MCPVYLTLMFATIVATFITNTLLMTLQPPSRIADLLITNVDQNGPSEPGDTVLVTMTWTAVGEDLNTGTGKDLW